MNGFAGNLELQYMKVKYIDLIILYFLFTAKHNCLLIDQVVAAYLGLEIRAASSC